VTPEESLTVTELVYAACPQQKMEEYTPDAWHLLLADLDFRDATEAAVSICKRSPFCSPAEIRAEIKRVREARLTTAGTVADQVDADPDDLPAWKAELLARRGMVAAGEAPPPPVEHPKRPIGDVLKRVGDAWQIPDDVGIDE
jgi:hypothetical protein